MRERLFKDLELQNLPVEPFLRWVGGKQQIVKHLLAFLPQDIRNRAYVEPFAGAGSLFFALQPCKAKLSDANEHLIECYKHVKESPELIHRYLRSHLSLNSEEYYYAIRDQYNESDYTYAQAARFIYLNKACYNGIFRVNKKGQFNVPYGSKSSLAIPTLNQLRRVCAALQTASLNTASYEESLGQVKPSEFIYIDPPYPPLNGTAYFTHYTSNRFDEEDQRRLADLLFELSSRGCKIMISNADIPFIRKIYKGFNIFKLSVTRFVTCKSVRHQVSELVLTNYRDCENI